MKAERVFISFCWSSTWLISFTLAEHTSVIMYLLASLSLSFSRSSCVHSVGLLISGSYDSSVKYTSSALSPTQPLILYLSLALSLSAFFPWGCSPLPGQPISHLGHVSASQKTLLSMMNPSHADDEYPIGAPPMSWIWQRKCWIISVGTPSLHAQETTVCRPDVWSHIRGETQKHFNSQIQ